MPDSAPTDPWDEHADAWDDDAATRDYAASAYESLVGALAKRGLTLNGATVCDFGCGTGLLTERLANTARTIDAVDTSTAMLDQLAAKVERRGFTNVHASSNLPSSVESHDLVVCSSVLGFVTDYPATVADLALLLRPTGVLVQWDWERDSDDADSHGLTRDEMRGALTAAGLIAVELAIAFEITIEGETMQPLMGIGQKP